MSPRHLNLVATSQCGQTVPSLPPLLHPPRWGFRDLAGQVGAVPEGEMREIVR
jgi:hypothetical protein